MKVQSNGSIQNLPIVGERSDSNKEPSVSRRNFIRAVGLASGAAAAAPFMPGTVGKAVAHSIMGTGSPVKIGIMLDRLNPRSANLMKGLHLYIKQWSERRGGRLPEIITEETGASLHSRRQIAEKLIVADQVSFVLAAANSRAIEGIEKIFEQANVPLIEVSAGEVIPKNAITSPYVFRSTLNLWQAHAAMGHWAATNVGKRAAIACSLFNAGFDFHRSFIAGFEEAGGEIAKLFVTGSSNGEHPFAIMEPMKSLGVDLVYGSYSSYDSLVFAQAYAASGIDKPLFGTDFNAGTGNTAAIGSSNNYFATTWTPSLGNAENAQFISDYRAFTGSDPDGFACLGYDTARMALTATESVGGNCRSTAFLDALARVQFRGPRGQMRGDAMVNTLVSPLYSASYAKGTSLNELTTRPATHNKLQYQNETGTTSGWLNPYHAV
jgi:branched-chain amino acid transport system substrate-binding protein